jgi:hypothetical protein
MNTMDECLASARRRLAALQLATAEARHATAKAARLATPRQTSASASAKPARAVPAVWTDTTRGPIIRHTAGFRLLTVR